MSGTAILGAVASLASQAQANKSNFVNGLLGSATSVYNTYMTNKANRELAEYSYGKDLEQWRREVEYNTPLNQMKRYQEAGLNPNLIYSQGNPGNSSVSSPSYKAPTLSYAYTAPRIGHVFNFLDMLNSYQNAKAINAEVGLKNAQEVASHAQASDYAATAALKIRQEAKTKYELELAKKMEENALKIQESQMFKHQYDAEMQRLAKEEATAQYEFKKASGTLGRDWINDFLQLLGLALPFAGKMAGIKSMEKRFPLPSYD